MGENGTLSASDVALLTGNGGGNNGNGYGGWGDSSFFWIFALLILANGGFGGWGNNGNNGGGSSGGGYGNMMLGYDFPWLLNGQQGINSNVSDGFRDAQLNDNITSVRDGISALSTQLCGCCGDMQTSLCNGFAGVNATINGGFANAETAANARQIANMQQAFAAQTATTNGLSNLSAQLAQCCCDNRLATCQTQNAIVSEGSATRFADAANTRDIIQSQTQGTQAILDKLCQLELDGVKAQVDAKNDRIAELTTQLNMANLAASQTAQTAQILAGQTAEIDGVYNRLKNCPVPSMPVYGNTPIFTCNNNGCGCGCGCSGNI